MSTNPAPVLLFTYKRLEPLKRTVQALMANSLAAETEVYIFSDGPKQETDAQKVAEVRSYLKSVQGFRKVNIIAAERNKGLAPSIIDGVSQVIAQHGKVIVLEDDLVTSSNFLLFMNQGLAQYESNKTVFSLAGYTPPMDRSGEPEYDAYFFPRNCSHGWATWIDRWENIDWAVSDYDAFRSSREQQAAFNKGGSDLSGMLKRQMEGKIDSWSIRFCYHQFKTGTCTVYPAVSKVQNVGFDKNATHTSNYNRFHTVLDQGIKKTFRFPGRITYDTKFAREFRKFYSIRARGIGKMKTYLQNLGLLKNVPS